MNTVLLQELMRFNRLSAVIKESLENLVKAIEGLVMMSRDLEIVSSAIFDNYIPATWRRVLLTINKKFSIKHSYPSEKPLQSFILDFVARVKYMEKWVGTGPPSNYWISGMFFT